MSRAPIFVSRIAIGCLLAAASARASPKLQGIGDASVGYTDNIQSAPDQPAPGVSPKSGGVFIALSPAVMLADASERTNQRVRYTYTYDLFLQRTSASTSSNRLEYTGFFDLSPRVSLLVGAAAIQSNFSSSLLLTAPGAGAVNATPAGSESFLSASANEMMSFDLAPGWRAYEGVVVAEQTPVFNTVAPRTFNPTARAGVEESFERDAVGLEARGDFSVVQGSVNPNPVGTQPQPAGTQRQLIGTGVAVWRHDWGAFLTSRAEAGALRVERLNTGRGIWQPSAAASLAYVPDFGDAELAYDHTVATNLLLGQTFLLDEVRLRGAIPLTKKGEFLAAASVGYQHGRLLDQDLNFAAHVDTVLADVGVGWQVTESILVDLRYQHFEQISSATVPPLPISFNRNSILAGASFRFPPDTEMPRAYRAPRRVDRADEIRDAVEPTESGVRGQPGGPAK